MKKRIYFLIASLLLLAGVQTAMAQKMIVTKTNDQVIEFKVSQVRDVTFQELAPVTMIITMKDSQVNRFEMSKVKNAAFVEVHEWVDLELPSGTVWATCNIGAEEPEEYGDYFAWGETKPKEAYTWGTYKWMAEGQADWYYINKYTIPDGEKDACWYSGETFIGDGKTELEPGDDAAAVKWGGGWRMPSREQIKELLDKNNTTTEWTTQNGVYGRRITSLRNGKSIFLPAAGSFGASGNGEEGSRGRYLSNALDASFSDGAFYMYFGPSSINYGNTYRYYGHSIRPVALFVKEIKLNHTSLTMTVNGTIELKASVLPENATSKAVTWKSSNTSIAAVDQTGKVKARALGSCVITCTATDGSDVKAECKVTVSDVMPAEYEYVDLGLPSGTLWATMNVGANNPEDYGSHFAWGETEPKNIYTWETYKYCKPEGDGYVMTKYADNDDPNIGFIELQPEDDAATANWGSGWQMPSLDQIVELYNSDYTTTTWITQYGSDGILVTSKSNGKSIFLPAAGFRSDSNPYFPGSYGYYWSRSLHTGYSNSAYDLYFFSSDISWERSNRYLGLPVRPVRVDNYKYVLGIYLDYTSLYLKPDNTMQLTATVWPLDAANRTVTWKSSNTSIATVDKAGKVTAKALGSCVITCSANDGSGVKAECKVTVSVTDRSGSLGGKNYVDLGLPSGTLWATMNVGADSPEDYGDYFAWGETKTKSEYSWEGYKYSMWDGSRSVPTKYSYHGGVDDYDLDDGLRELLPEDDAATANWGSGWQMPSDKQIRELFYNNNTTYKWTTQNGVNGVLITASNGNSIFLPAAGYIDNKMNSGLDKVGEWCDYWSRSLMSPSYEYPTCRAAHNIHMPNYTIFYENRYCGLPVRPVRKQ